MVRNILLFQITLWKFDYFLNEKVESKSLNLLTHPLVGSLLHHKWKKFGQYGYFINLFTYCVFLTFLTVFALIIENPRSSPCKIITMIFIWLRSVYKKGLEVAMNANETESDIECGKTLKFLRLK